MTGETSLTRTRRASRACASLLAAGLAILLGTPAVAQDDGWVLDPTARVEIGAVSAQSATRDEQIIVDGDAFTFRGQIGLNLENDRTRLRLEADRIEVVRPGEGRRESNRDRLTAQLDQDIGKDWEIQLRGRVYDDLVTAESSDTDETQASVRVTYQPKRAHRFRLRGTWRDREYDNGSADATKGDGPRLDAEYRHRMGRYHYFSLGARTESIKSDDADRGYSRQSARVSYTRPLNRNLRVRPALEFINTEFDGRLTPDGARRKDQLIVPEVELLWWPDKWRVEAEAKYIFSDSNQPTRQREGYRLTLSVGYVF